MNVGFIKKVGLLVAVTAKCVRDVVGAGMGTLADRVQPNETGQFRHGARRAVLLAAAAPFLSLYYLSKRKGRVATVMACCVVVLSALLLLEVNSIVYEYSYNGRVLGMVKSEDVLQKAIKQIDGKTTGAEEGPSLPAAAQGNSGAAPQAASLPDAAVPAAAAPAAASVPAPVSPVAAPSSSAQIAIDENTDIQVKTVKMPLFSPVPTDNSEGVISSLSAQPDVKVKAWEITADDTPIADLAGEQSATEVKDAVLAALETNFLGDQDRSAYKQIGFKENVQIMEIRTTANNLVKPEDAYTEILKDGKLHLLTVEDAQYQEAIPFETTYQDTGDLYQGEENIITPGVAGVKAVTGQIVKVDGKETQRIETASNIVSEPTNQISERGTKPAPPKLGTGTYIVPTKDKDAVITSFYGLRWGTIHPGQDYGEAMGTDVLASDTGRVIESGWDAGFGLTVKIDHGAGWVTLYGHLMKTDVQVGDMVQQGQVIAQSGDSGFSTGPHLHFGLYHFDNAVDPRTVLKDDPTPVALSAVDGD